LHSFIAFAGTKSLLALTLVLLGALVEGIGILLIVPFLSVIIDSQGIGGWMQAAAGWFFSLFSAETRLSQLSLLLGLLALLMILRAAVITWRDLTIAKLQVGFIQQVRVQITRRLASARWDTVSRLRHSRIMHLMGTDIQRLEGATYILLRDVIAVVMVVGQIVLAFLLAPFLAAAVIGLVFVGTATILPMMRRAREVGSFVTSANLSLINNVTQFLGALKLAISQNLQASFTREFEATLSELGKQQIRYVWQQAITSVSITVLSGLGGALSILLGVAVFDVSSPILITVLLILTRISGPVLQLQIDAQQLAHSLPAYEKFRELDNELILAEAITPSAICGPAPPSGPIIFKAVSFIHPSGGSPAGTGGGVRDLNLTIEEGSIVGISGPSGAGKTTFADLVAGLYAPQTGDILIGGVPLRGQSILAWRNSISYVAQDPFLFHDTIRGNLLWAEPNADEATLWDALRRAGAEEFVRNAAQGLDTLVGERGSLFSGGERQRLALARALLRRPRLLLLDEATNAIDTEGERTVIERLLERVPRPTIIIIAHRWESLRYCHRVLILEEGRLSSDSAHPAADVLPMDVQRRQLNALQ
jgi:ATP-binding cassette subfamily C protein